MPTWTSSAHDSQPLPALDHQLAQEQPHPAQAGRRQHHRGLVVPPCVVRPQVFAAYSRERHDAQADQDDLHGVVEMDGVAPGDGVEDAEQDHQHHEPRIGPQRQVPQLGRFAETAGVPEHPGHPGRVAVLDAQVGGLRLARLQGEGEGRMQVTQRAIGSPATTRPRAACCQPPAPSGRNSSTLSMPPKGTVNTARAGRRDGGQLQAVPDRDTAAQRHDLRGVRRPPAGRRRTPPVPLPAKPCRARRSSTGPGHRRGRPRPATARSARRPGRRPPSASANTSARHSCRKNHAPRKVINARTPLARGGPVPTHPGLLPCDEVGVFEGRPKNAGRPADPP